MSLIQAISHTIKKTKEIRLSKNIVSYLICVAIASILWLLNALSKDYSAELTYPVKYTNFPEGKFPVVKLPAKLQLEVKAKGFTLLGYRLKTSFLPITFNVSTYTDHIQPNKGILEYTLNTGDIKDKIKNQINPDIKLLKVYPEKIRFKFAVAKHKKVAIHPTLDYTLKRQYILTHITTVPDSIWLSGPASVIDTIKYITTAPLHLKELSKNTSRKLKLLAPPDCTFNEESAEILLEVEQFTEAKHTIPITPLHVPDFMNIRLFPPNVNISYEIGLSKYDKVNEQDFVFSIDSQNNSNTNFLEIKVSKAPKFIKNLTYSPLKVEYILEKK